MDIREIQKLYTQGCYTVKMEIPKKLPNDHIFDENLTVKRNKELIIEHNERVDKLREERRSKQTKLNQKLTNNIVEYIMQNFELTREQAKHVESFVYNHYHDSMYEYFNSIDYFAEFAETLITSTPKE